MGKHVEVMSGPAGCMKIAKPRLPKVLPRSRLFALLERSADHAAWWIAGPPGAGKTVLAASYLAERKLPHIWYQIGTSTTDKLSWHAPRRLSVEVQLRLTTT